MIFWIAVAVLSAAVTYAVTRPLAGDAHAADDDAAADLAIYKDQLREIDVDASRGALSPVEADAARAEVARRLIRADASGHDRKSAAKSGAAAPRAVYVGASLMLPLASLGLYLAYGTPGLPGQPLEARLTTPTNAAHANDLIAKVEAALRANPQDGKGWDVIAPVYLSLGRADDAASAYATAIRLLGEDAKRLEGFADARIRAENGLIPEDARKALEKLAALQPTAVEPKIWLGMAKEQDGDVKGAIADYRALLTSAPADARWRKMVEERVATLEGGGKPGPDAAGKDPDAAEIAAFQKMTPDERAAKINGMVDQLATRLKTEPGDLAGWQQLIRAYAALGRKDDALKAAALAREGLRGDEARLRALEDWIKQMGLTG